MASAALGSTEVRDGLWARYREAYSVAAGIISFGKLAQTIAVVVGALILLVSLVTGLRGESWFLLGIGVVIAMIVGGGGWISGMIIMAQGQIIQSVIDTAVNTSPLLDNPSKAQFLHLILKIKEDEAATAAKAEGSITAVQTRAQWEEARNKIRESTLQN